MADYTDTRTAARQVAMARPPHDFLARLLREPLLHFMLIGASLFAASHFLDTARGANKVVVVTSEIRQQLSDEFAAVQGRPPDDAEYRRISLNWLRNEILYREAAALKLDSGDDMIHERMAQKMRLLVFGRVSVPKPTEADLRAWFNVRRAELDIPIQYDFFEAPVDGPDGETQAQAYLADIQAGNEPTELRMRARAFANRSPAVVGEVFGQGFAASLATLPPRTWQMVQGDSGWHLVNLDAVHPGKPADFEALRAAMEIAWSEDRRRQLAVREVENLSAGYNTRREDLR